MHSAMSDVPKKQLFLMARFHSQVCSQFCLVFKRKQYKDWA